MQAVMETAFDILYLCTVCILGITMIRKARGNRMLFLFGIMAVTLGLGDAFHLIPRAYALCIGNRKIYHIHYNDHFLPAAVSHMGAAL